MYFMVLPFGLAPIMPHTANGDTWRAAAPARRGSPLTLVLCLGESHRGAIRVDDLKELYA
jgi:hypothetical protein